MITPINLRDLSFIAANMRPEDKAEICCQWAEWDATYFSFAVLNSVFHDLSWVSVLKGQPVAAFGFGPASAKDPDIWQGWAFGTKRFKRAVPEMTRWLKKQRPEIEKMSVRRVQAFTLTSHDISHHWLSALGARHEGTMRSYGRNGEDFDIYAWVK